jgi:hypothetical protein
MRMSSRMVEHDQACVELALRRLSGCGEVARSSSPANQAQM